MGPDWRSPANGTLIAGPIAWPVLRQLATDSGGPPAASYAPRHGLATSVKALVAVNAGTVVRVRIPASERMRLSLDYTYIQTGRNTSQGTYFRVADGASQVTFKACSLAQNPTGQPSQFAGGFIVAGAQCARIDIYTSAKSRPLVRQLPLGVQGAPVQRLAERRSDRVVALREREQRSVTAPGRGSALRAYSELLCPRRQHRA